MKQKFKSFFSTILNSTTHVSRTSLLRFVICAVLASTGTQSFAGIIRSADFENGDYQSHGLRPVGKGEPIVVTSPEPICRGNYSLKLPLDFYKNKNKFRNQLAWGNSLKIGEEYWIGYAMYVPSDILRPRVNIDLHGIPDKHLGETYRTSAFGIYGGDYRYKGQIQVRARSSAKPVNMPIGQKQTADRNYLKPVAKLEKKWVEVVVHFKLTYRQDGFINVWIDGKKVLTEKNIGTAWNDVKGPYFKFGIHVLDWINRVRPKPGKEAYKLAYFDEIRIGDKNASYDDVAPRCGGVKKRPGPSTPPNDPNVCR